MPGPLYAVQLLACNPSSSEALKKKNNNNNNNNNNNQSASLTRHYKEIRIPVFAVLYLSCGLPLQN